MSPHVGAAAGGDRGSPDRGGGPWVCTLLERRDLTGVYAHGHWRVDELSIERYRLRRAGQRAGAAFRRQILSQRR